MNLGKGIGIFYRLLRRCRRMLMYVIQRTKRIKETPHKIALGLSLGVFVAFMPLFGFHFLISIFLAWLLGGNMLSSMLGTFIFNPLTFSFIWIASFKLGQFIMYFYQRTFLSSRLSQNMNPLLEVSDFNFSMHTIQVMFVGGIPLGFIAAVCLYWPTRLMLQRYQERQRYRACKRKVMNETEAS